MSDMDSVREDAAQEIDADDAAGRVYTSAEALQHATEAREAAEEQLLKSAKASVQEERSLQASVDEAREAEDAAKKAADEAERDAGKTEKVVAPDVRPAGKPAVKPAGGSGH